MSDVDPLIKRELQWMALGTLENRDLASIVIRKAKRRRIRLLAMILAGILGISLGVFGVFNVINNKSGTSIFSADTGATGSTDSSAISPAQIRGVITDYPVTWEESIGDLGAISKPGGVGDTIGGLTATGLKKWKPTTRLGCCRPADIFSTDREDVLVASTHSGEICFSSSLKRSFLSCNSSNTASMMKSQPA